MKTIIIIIIAYMPRRRWIILFIHLLLCTLWAHSPHVLENNCFLKQLWNFFFLYFSLIIIYLQESVGGERRAQVRRCRCCVPLRGAFSSANTCLYVCISQYEGAEVCWLTKMNFQMNFKQDNEPGEETTKFFHRALTDENNTGNWN